MPKVLASLSNFLRARRKSHNGPDLLDRWTPNMETQVNVSAGSGDRVDGKRNTWTDGVNEWWNIRIPKNANSTPEFRDYDLSWPLDEHAEAIGCTGWDWSACRSRWVGFDYDSITGHAAGVGITDAELARVSEAAQALPYVEVRKSTGGNGLHLYVYFDEAGIPTGNHTEHAALGRAILGMMASETGFDFASQIDVCGGNMWIWHRKMNERNQGLKQLKPAEKCLSLADLPSNWRDHIEVVTRKRSKIRVPGISEAQEGEFDAFTLATARVALDDKHRAIIRELARSASPAIWNSDHHLLQTHTLELQKLAQNKELGIRGLFETASSGSTDINCYAFPATNGAFKVFRFGEEVAEAPSWTRENGRTCCFFNRPLSFEQACKMLGGAALDGNRGFAFDQMPDAQKAVELLGKTFPFAESLTFRHTALKQEKNGRIVVQTKRYDDDAKPGAGWTPQRGPIWQLVVDVPLPAAEETDNSDAYVRVTVTPRREGAGTYVRSLDGWDLHSPTTAKMYLQGLGFSKPDAEALIGQGVRKPWQHVSLPFQPEYPGDRRWNGNAAQFRFAPASDRDGDHPHWDLILDHLGKRLTPSLKTLAWAQEANIKTGADYLRAWYACMYREPFQQLPYLFFSGPENCGKSIFWEAMDACMVRGVVKADSILAKDDQYTARLDGSVLCVIEETDVAKAKGARNRLKDFVTAKTLAIRKMRTDVYHVPNCTHWLQNSNSTDSIPICFGDTRITAISVGKITSEVAKTQLLANLVEEGPAFLRTLLDMTLPGPQGRLRLPVVETAEKKQLISDSSPVASFIEEECERAPQLISTKKEVFDRYKEWCKANGYEAARDTKFGRQFCDYLDDAIDSSGKVTNAEGKRVNGYRGVGLVTCAA